jgi:hypothetical protein
VTSGQIRARHFLWWKLLAVLVPLLVAAALLWRPTHPPASAIRVSTAPPTTN